MSRPSTLFFVLMVLPCDNISNEMCAIDVSFDAGWQKRGSGHSYNSRSAHGTMIGRETGACVAFGLVNTDCRKCLFDPVKLDHDCIKNYEGSSKAMESALAIDLAKRLREKGYSISNLTMDDDTTTISRLHESSDISIQKRSDKNHVRKNISKQLLNLRDKHKTLSSKVVDYLNKDISYAISQNKENEENLKLNIKAIVPHSFGDHSFCNLQWCGFLKDKDQYKHKSLPYGKDLSDDELRKDLDDLFKIYHDNSKKLANLGSTQANESLNQIVNSKAPKFKHFGGSNSLELRLNAAVAQKNEGRKYIHEVNAKHGLSPGKFTLSHSYKLDKKRKAEKEKEITKRYKRLRLSRKKSRCCKQKAKKQERELPIKRLLTWKTQMKILTGFLNI